MSHYTTCNSQMKNRDCIVKALERMGFNRTDIEVSDTPMALKTYGGSSAGRKANIRIKGYGWGSENRVGSLCNDIGFELTKDGTYTMHVCDYADRAHSIHKNSNFLNLYTAEVIKDTASYHHFFVETEDNSNNEIKLELHSSF